MTHFLWRKLKCHLHIEIQTACGCLQGFSTFMSRIHHTSFGSMPALPQQCSLGVRTTDGLPVQRGMHLQQAPSCLTICHSVQRLLTCSCVCHPSHTAQHSTWLTTGSSSPSRWSLLVKAGYHPALQWCPSVQARLCACSTHRPSLGCTAGVGPRPGGLPCRCWPLPAAHRHPTHCHLVCAD